LKSDEKSLTRILSQDEEDVKKGDFGSIWTSGVSFYPSAKNRMFEKEFSDFMIVGDSEKPRLGVYGLTEGKEEKIFEFEFTNRELMLHVYYCLVSSLGSHRKITTLRELLDKTTVAVIQPNTSKSTVNILGKLKDELAKESVQEKFEADIATIDNYINDCEAQIDATVFKIYGLNRREINMVMETLSLLSSYQERVLRYLKS
jgi:hypothetical protein